MRRVFLSVLVIVISLPIFGQPPPRPKNVSHYSRSTIRLIWRVSKNKYAKEYIKRNVSSLAVEDETLNEIAKLALFKYITRDPKAHSNLPHQKTPKYYIPDSLKFELNTLPVERNYGGYYNILESYKELHYSISSTSLQYQGKYVTRYGSVWFDVYDPDAGAFKGLFLVVVKLWYDDGHQVWTKNQDIDIN